MRRALGLIGVLLCVGAATPVAAHADVLYAAGLDGNLYELNPVDGSVAKTVGPIGMQVADLEIDPTDRTLYALEEQDLLTAGTEPRDLMRVNKTTGAGTYQTTFPPDPDGDNPGEVAISPAGASYGWLEPNKQELATVNLMTGNVARIGPSGLATGMSGLAFSSSGTLYLAGDIDRLQTINTTTGVPTAGPTLSDRGLGLFSLAFDGAGTLFGLRERSDGLTSVFELVTIDTATGAVAVRGPVSTNISSIAFDVPPPSDPGGGNPGGGSPGGGSQQDTVAPAVTRFRLRAGSFRAARRGPSAAAAVGTRVSYRLSEAAISRFTVRRAVRTRGKLRYRRVRGSFSRAGGAGRNSFRFTGRLRARQLRPGAYRLVLTATDAAGNKSAPKYAAFRIVRR